MSFGNAGAAADGVFVGILHAAELGEFLGLLFGFFEVFHEDADVFLLAAEIEAEGAFESDFLVREVDGPLYVVLWEVGVDALWGWRRGLSSGCCVLDRSGAGVVACWA